MINVWRSRRPAAPPASPACRPSRAQPRSRRARRRWPHRDQPRASPSRWCRPRHPGARRDPARRLSLCRRREAQLQRQAGHARRWARRRWRLPRSTPCGGWKASGCGSGSGARTPSTRWTMCWSHGSAPRDLISRRFVQDFVENDKPTHRLYEIYPDSGFFRQHGRDTTLATPAEPLDDAGFFYFVRVTPLEVGKKYTYDRYFRKEKNPVTIEVLKREKMELPDGTKVQCLVLHPGHRHQGALLQALGDPHLADRRRSAAAGADPHQVSLRHHHPPAQGHGSAWHDHFGHEPLIVPYREADLSRLTTIPVAGRRNKVDQRLLASPPGTDRSFSAFLDSLPDVLAARDLRQVIQAVAGCPAGWPGRDSPAGRPRREGGAGSADQRLAGPRDRHPCRHERGRRDPRLRAGGVRRDQRGRGGGPGGRQLRHGGGDRRRDERRDRRRGARRDQGMGEGLSRALARRKTLPGAEASILLAAQQHDVPVTVHAAIGAEIIHQHPTADGAAVGATSHRDFRRLAASIPDLHQGGVVLNWGSAVLMPEVFLKALTIARNLEGGTTHSLHRGRLRHAAALPAPGQRGAAAHPRRRQRAFCSPGTTRF